ncbi:MAG: hypothetical protein A2W31_15835 [Planctomycetes bacterium RBG_16_64_10]|nr:MAG: hypothetical protein A2W31_15835 [Planctomycetes bacterium RBG_16_64_10]
MPRPGFVPAHGGPDTGDFRSDHRPVPSTGNMVRSASERDRRYPHGTRLRRVRSFLLLWSAPLSRLLLQRLQWTRAIRPQFAETGPSAVLSRFLLLRKVP